jgi:hypothetical protein
MAHGCTSSHPCRLHLPEPRRQQGPRRLQLLQQRLLQPQCRARAVRGGADRGRSARGAQAHRGAALSRLFPGLYQHLRRRRAPRRLYRQALAEPDVIGLSVGTRPDCVPDAVLDLLAGCVPRAMRSGWSWACNRPSTRPGAGQPRPRLRRLSPRRARGAAARPAGLHAPDRRPARRGARGRARQPGAGARPRHRRPQAAPAACRAPHAAGPANGAAAAISRCRWSTTSASPRPDRAHPGRHRLPPGHRHREPRHPARARLVLEEMDRAQRHRERAAPPRHRQGARTGRMPRSPR